MERQPTIVSRTQVDGLWTEVHRNRAEMGVAAGQAVGLRVRDLLARQEGARLIFASAPSQNEFLAELRSFPGLNWNRVTAFHLDEYVGLAPESPRSFSRFLVHSLFSSVAPGAFHALNGLAADPEGECERYAALLNEAPIDILCCGIGENGHLAFNDPPVADFADPRTVKIVELTLESREQQVHDGTFPTLADVPRQALTLTIPALMGARHVYCVVPGPAKAAAVRDTLLRPIGTACPATAMRRHPSATLYLDLDAAALYQGKQ
jgi:glucosamine-6-phosphate deaminase